MENIFVLGGKIGEEAGILADSFSSLPNTRVIPDTNPQEYLEEGSQITKEVRGGIGFSTYHQD